MSVAYFSADELANAAAFLLNTRDMSAEWMREIVTDLATYSTGNAWAFNTQYRGENVPAVTRGEIAECLTWKYGRFECDRGRACSTLRLLSYNGVTNNGDEANTPGYFQALARTLDAFSSRLLATIEAGQQAA